MVDIRPIRIPGRWSDGRALDVHTVRSTYVGDDEFGHPRFETQRSAMGDLLYRLKYKGDRSVVPAIAEAATAFVRSWQPGLELVVTVPPSRERTVQPVLLVGAALAEGLGLAFEPQVVRRSREAPQLKDVSTTMSVGGFSTDSTKSTLPGSRAGGFCYSTICFARGRR